MRKLILLLTVACFACSAETTGPPLTDSEVTSHSLLAAADPGNGAMVVRLLDPQFLLPTADPQSGLVSVHYASATFFSGFTGCVVPPFEEDIGLQLLTVPTGKQKRVFNGLAYVRVYDLAGFPGNVFGCTVPIAEGSVNIHGVDHLEAPGAFGTATGSFTSNGLITHNADGSDVRLHHKTKLDGLGTFPPPGTVRLR